MQYSLSPEEIEKVRDLVRILTNVKWDGGILSPKEEERCVELAEEISRFIT